MDKAIFAQIGAIIDSNNAIEFEVIGYKMVETYLKLYYYDRFIVVKLKMKGDKVDVNWGEYQDYPDGEDSYREHFKSHFEPIVEAFKGQ